MNDFGQSPLLLGRVSRDGGFIGVLGGAIALFAFAANPALAAAWVLTVANDITYSNGNRRRTAASSASDLSGGGVAIEDDADLTQALKAIIGAEFKEVQPKSSVLGSAKSSGDAGEDDAPGDGWDDTAWIPPAPDLSLLPIAEFRAKIAKGSLDPKRLTEDNYREHAARHVAAYYRHYSNHDNVEFAVWASFGITKGGNNWYAIAADFCAGVRAAHDSGFIPDDVRRDVKPRKMTSPMTGRHEGVTRASRDRDAQDDRINF